MVARIGNWLGPDGFNARGVYTVDEQFDFRRRGLWPDGSLVPTTWNPSDKAAGITLSNGNLTASGATSSPGSMVRSAASHSSGKWYFELTFTQGDGTHIGIATTTASLNGVVGYDASGWSYTSAGFKRNNNSAVSYGSAASPGDIISVLVDLDALMLEFWRNGTSMGVAYSGLPAGTYFAAWGENNPVVTDIATVNFGANAFVYSPPAGYRGGF